MYVSGGEGAVNAGRRRRYPHAPRRLAMASAPRPGSGGTVLIVSMWVILVLVGLVLVLGRSVRIDALSSANSLSLAQARAVAHGAAQFVLARVEESAGNPAPVLSEPCDAVQVGDGRFWILRPDLDDDRAYAFGIRDEASRINLNSASMEMLLKIPLMTSELAASILDWRDENSEVSPGGAENEYYLLLPTPYYCKNAPLEILEELLWVKGASEQLLYGEDANRNGVLDANENDGADSDPPDNADGHLDRGLLDYVTLYSREPNVSLSGGPRVNVNQAGGGALAELLREAVPEDRFFQVMDRVRGGRPFRNVLDFYHRAGLELAEFRQVADRLTTRNDQILVGLVNVNTASREVLLCLPALEESDVTALLSTRSATGTDSSNLAWVAETLPPEKAVEVGDYITTRSYQFSADVVSVSGDGRAFRRNWFVVDTTSAPPGIACWKDLTHLGWPLQPEIMSTLRNAGASAVALFDRG